MTAIDNLCGALGGIPRLHGSRCKGRSDVWDDYDDPATVEHAISVCQACPALRECSTWLESLPAHQRPHGVVAGQVRRPRQPRKRKKAA
jgi:WhiB family transcriptional regulator, redox-sensing transcriptional regulator